MKNYVAKMFCLVLLWVGLYLVLYVLRLLALRNNFKVLFELFNSGMYSAPCAAFLQIMITGFVFGRRNFNRLMLAMLFALLPFIAYLGMYVITYSDKPILVSDADRWMSVSKFEWTACLSGLALMIIGGVCFCRIQFYSKR